MKLNVFYLFVEKLLNRRDLLRWVFVIPVGLSAFVVLFSIVQVSMMTPEEKAASIERRAEALRINEGENAEIAAAFYSIKK